MLAAVPVRAEAVTELARTVRTIGADELADRLERALADEVKLLTLTIDERAIILASLDDPPDGLSELRGVLVNEHQWRLARGARPRRRVKIEMPCLRGAVEPSAEVGAKGGPAPARC